MSVDIYLKPANVLQLFVQILIAYPVIQMIFVSFVNLDFIYNPINAFLKFVHHKIVKFVKIIALTVFSANLASMLILLFVSQTIVLILNA